MAKSDLLGHLAEELLKDDPDQKKLKSLSTEIGLAYTKDHLSLMAEVLERLRTQQKPPKPQQKDLDL